MWVERVIGQGILDYWTGVLDCINEIKASKYTHSRMHKVQVQVNSRPGAGAATRLLGCVPTVTVAKSLTCGIRSHFSPSHA